MQQCVSLPRRYKSSGFDTASDFNRTACTRVKMEVVAPMPSASVRTVVMVKTGTLHRPRSAYPESASRGTAIHADRDKFPSPLPAPIPLAQAPSRFDESPEQSHFKSSALAAKNRPMMD